MRSLAAGSTVVGLFLVAHLAGPGTARGEVAMAPVVRFSGDDPACQNAPLVAPLRSGGFAVAWQDYFGPGKTLLRLGSPYGGTHESTLTIPGRRLEAFAADRGTLLLVLGSADGPLTLQRVTSSGETLGPEVPIDGTTALSRAALAVAPDGRIAVVVQSTGRVLARWFDETGAALGAASILADTVAHPSFTWWRPAATLDSAGRLVAVWSERVDAADHSAVRFRRVGTDGTTGATVHVAADRLPRLFDAFADVAALPDGALAVAWQRTDERRTSSVLLRRFGAGDAPLEDPQTVAPGYEPKLASDAGGRIAVSWWDGTTRLQVRGPGAAIAGPTDLVPELPEGNYAQTAALSFLVDGRLATVWNTWYDPNVLPTGCENQGIFSRVVDVAPPIPPPHAEGLEKPLGTSLTDRGTTPILARQANGSFLAVWRAYGCEVVAQRHGADGGAVGARQRLAPGVCAQADEIAVTALADGGWVVAWRRTPASEGPIGLRRVAADGTPAGNVVTIGGATARFPRLAGRTAAEGGVLVAWSAGDAGPMLAQAFDASLAPLSPVHEVGSAVTYLSDLASLADGDFVLAWNTAWDRVVARRLGSLGQPLADPVEVSTDGLKQIYPHVAADLGDGFAVAWTAWAPPFSYGSVARLRRFDRNGRPTGDPLDVEALMDLGWDDGRELLVRDLAVRRDGVAWLLFTRTGSWHAEVDALLVDRSTVVGPATPVAFSERSSFGTTASLVLDDCGAWASWGTWSTAGESPRYRRLATACAGDPSLLLGGRFRVEATWRLPGTSGPGFPLRLREDTGAFWFFGADNPELMVKILDGRALNGAFWLFYASLTSVEVDLAVTDLVTGERKVWTKPAGTLVSHADTRAFRGTAPRSVAPDSARAETPVPAATEKATTGPSTGTCAPDDTGLCLFGGRFRVAVRYVDPATKQERDAVAAPMDVEGGAFWFFSPANLELLVKIVDGRAVNGRFWVFRGGLSTVESTVTVTDTTTGAQRTYHHPAGAMRSAADTNAF